MLEELDVLDQGALFLSGGDREGTERLLEETTLAAYRAGASALLGDEPRPLERLMIQVVSGREADSIPPDARAAL